MSRSLPHQRQASELKERYGLLQRFPGMPNMVIAGKLGRIAHDPVVTAIKALDLQKAAAAKAEHKHDASNSANSGRRTKADSNKRSKQQRRGHAADAKAGRLTRESKDMPPPAPVAAAGSDDIVIHVHDEARKLKKDFKCNRSVLTRGMKYFEVGRVPSPSRILNCFACLCVMLCSSIPEPTWRPRCLCVVCRATSRTPLRLRK